MADKPLIPERWKKSYDNGAYHEAVKRGVAIEQKTWPYTVAITDENQEKVIWHPRNYKLGGNILVTFDLYPPHAERCSYLSDIFVALIQKFDELGMWKLMVSANTWLLGSEMSVSEIHQAVFDVMGIRSFSYTVVDLNNGYGIGWDASEGLMTEISTVSFVRE